MNMTEVTMYLLQQVKKLEEQTLMIQRVYLNEMLTNFFLCSDVANIVEQYLADVIEKMI